MKRLFSTADVHPRDRFDYWHEIACQKIVMHDSKPQCRQRFQSSIQAAALADAELIQFDNSPMEVWRTRKQVASGPSDSLFVCLQLRGDLVLEQNGRTVTLATGDMTLIDPDLPYAGRFSSQSELLVLKSPRFAIEARVGKARDVVARHIRTDEGEPRLLACYLASILTQIDLLSCDAARMVCDHVFDLVAVSVAGTMQSGTPKISSAKSLALLKLRAAIDSQLCNSALNPEAVAAAAGISIRYANALLEQDGWSIMRLVFERRLERCRAALIDPKQANRTVSEIASGWGFSDMTHFGRRFKAAYGIPPREYRQHGR